MTLKQNILTESYLFTQDPKASLKRSLVLGLGILLFFSLVKPFGMNLPALNILLVGSGILLAAIFLQLGLSWIVKTTALREKWTLGMEVVKTICYLTLLAFLSSTIAGLMGWVKLDSRSISNFTFYTFAYGIIPIAISKLWEQNRRLTALVKKQSTESKSDLIKLISPQKTDQFEGLLSDIKYLQSDGNYVIVHHADAKHHMRLTLKSACEQLANYDFEQVHRSYLVNPLFIEKVMSRHLILKDGTRLPISRQFRSKVVQGRAT